MPEYDTTKWAPVNAPATPAYDTTKWAPVDEAGAALSKVPVQMSQAPGLGARIMDEAERVGGYAGGAAIASPSGPVGMGLAGGIGATGADVDIARRHQKEYGTPIDLSPGNIAKDAALNVGGGVVGEKFLGPLLGKIGSGALGMIRGEPALEAGAREAAVKVEVPVKDFASKQTDIERETQDALRTKRQDIAKGLTPEAQQAAIQESTGRVPAATQQAMTQPAEAGTALPGQGQVGRAQRFYNDITSPLRRSSDAWAAKRDKLMAPFMEQRVDTAPLTGAINDELAYAQQNGKSFSPALQKLAARAKSLTGRELTPDEYMNPEFMANLEQQGLLEPRPEVGSKPQLPPNATDEQKIALAKELENRSRQASVAPRMKAGTVNQLLGVRSVASGLANSSTSATDRHLAGSIADGVDETLTQINAPSLKPLNAQYRGFKTLFPRQFSRAISSAAEPVDTAPQIFDQPQRALHLLNGAQPEEKQTLRTLYADWVNRDGAKVIKPEHAPILAQMFPRTPLGTPEGFARITSREMGVEDLLKTSPEVRQHFMQEFQPAAKEIVENGMRDTTKAAVMQARKMGPLGQQIVQRIEAQTDPVEQFKIATEAMTGVTPDKAAQAAIQSGYTGKTSGSSYFIERSKSLLALYAIIGGPALASGHLNFSGAMMLMGGVMTASEFAKRAFYKSLENPEAVQNYWRALNGLSEPSSMRIIARQAANAMLSDVVGTTGKAITGTTLEKAPDNKPTPMTRQFDRSTAEKVSGVKADPSRTEHVETLNRDLRKGKTPDVAGGLRTGRLSMPAVKRLLKMQSAKTAPALVSHLGPADLKHMLALASPEEEAWLKPLVEQRLGNNVT